jgi:hypothetical protein
MVRKDEMPEVVKKKLSAICTNKIKREI